MVDYIDNRRNKYVIPYLEESKLVTLKKSRSKNEVLFQSGMSYMRARGFKDCTLETYEICVDTKTEMLVFPQRTRTGQLRFIQKRKIGNNYHGAKFINEGITIKKISSSVFTSLTILELQQTESKESEWSSHLLTVCPTTR